MIFTRRRFSEAADALNLVKVPVLSGGITKHEKAEQITAAALSFRVL